MTFRLTILTAAACAATLAGQVVGPDTEKRGAPLKLVPSEPLSEPRFPKQTEPPKATSAATGGVRPAILSLKPVGDPIYLVEEPAVESDRDKWRTYQRPKVDRVSKDGEGVAIQGYDVLSYFEKRAEKGREEFSVEYGGINWYFASSDHRDQFRQDPERFLPEYGGFCAYSVGRGYPATADPRVYIVEGRKLYLFFDRAVQTVWAQDQRHLITSANRYWPQLHR
jgi:YHS domain-containing protein